METKKQLQAEANSYCKNIIKNLAEDFEKLDNLLNEYNETFNSEIEEVEDRIQECLSVEVITTKSSSRGIIEKGIKIVLSLGGPNCHIYYDWEENEAKIFFSWWSPFVEAELNEEEYKTLMRLCEVYYMEDLYFFLAE